MSQSSCDCIENGPKNHHLTLPIPNYFLGAMIKSLGIEETGNKYVRKGEKTDCSNSQQRPNHEM